MSQDKPPHQETVNREDGRGPSRYRSINAAVSTAADATGRSFDFFSTVLAGLALGLGVDWLAGTGPVVTIVGIVLGFIAGFYKLWEASAVLEEQAERRRR